MRYYKGMKNTTATIDHLPCKCCGGSINRNAAATTVICSWCKAIHPIGRQISRTEPLADQERPRRLLLSVRQVMRHRNTAGGPGNVPPLRADVSTRQRATGGGRP